MMLYLRNSIVLLYALLVSKGCGSLHETETRCETNQKLLDDMEALLTKYLGESALVTMASSLNAKQSAQAVARSWRGGATFTRWGRTECPSGNNFVYRGFSGGSNYNQKGGGVNVLCLPERPLYANYTATKQGSSTLYGSEYETSATFMSNLHDQDVPCVVCQSRSQRNVIMVPARNECLPGWRLEYWGYLMAAHASYTSSDFVCVDNKAEKASGGHENKNGQTLYMVESICGALPCPPYQNYWEVTCAVCTN